MRHRKQSPPRNGSFRTVRRQPPLTYKSHEETHFQFGANTNEVLLERMRPHVMAASRAHLRKPKEVAAYLNKQGLKTACNDRWTTRLTSILLKMLFEGPETCRPTPSTTKPSPKANRGNRDAARGRNNEAGAGTIINSLKVPNPLITPATGRRKGQRPGKKAAAAIRNRTKALKIDPLQATEHLERRSDKELIVLWRNIQRYHKTQVKPSKVALGRIEKEWRRRATANEAGVDGYFPWPSTEATVGPGSFAQEGWPASGLLAFLGYHVGSTHGIDVRSRQSILAGVFRGPIPPVGSFQYYQSWGRDQSAERLKKLAESLAAFARNAKRRHQSDMSAAIADWEEDLGFLYRDFYVDQFKFVWPYAALRK